MQSEIIIFSILALLTLSSAIAMISVHRVVDAALSFIITLVSIAGLFALLHSTFLFASQIIIYAGAIMTLIIFIIMFLNIKPENLPHEPKKKQLMFFATLVTMPFTLFLIKLINATPLIPSIEQVEGMGGIKHIGEKLYSNWVLPFELISILLLVSLIGSIILAKRDEKKEKREGNYYD